MSTGGGPIVPLPVTPPNLQLCGWVDAVDAAIAEAEIVVGAAGDGLVNAVLAADKPFVCRREPRAYGEQTLKAERPAQLGAAVSLDHWPDGGRWPAVLAESLSLRPADRRRISGEGLGAAGVWLVELAATLEERA